MLGVPLLHDGEALGVIVLHREIPGGFDDAQIALVQSFADQAVIAMENARLVGALRARTDDLQQSLDYQTATSDVLKVISQSAFDLQPVLDTVAETAARLCVAEMASIFRRDGETLHIAANVGFPPEFEADWRALGAVPWNLSAPASAGAPMREQRPVHVEDAEQIPGYLTGPITRSKLRTALGVPLLRDGEVLGTIVLGRQRVEPFTDRQIDLVRTFADQAVIAMENARLIAEQREALERQTATSEVLQVINASPGDLAPVFETMLDKAMRLCGVAFGLLYTFEGDRRHVVASRGLPPAFADFTAQEFRHERNYAGASSADGVEADQPAGFQAGRGYLAGHAYVRALVDLGGARTTLLVPLLRNDTAIACFSLYRQEVRPFAEKEIALLESFAAQAVIAMENARLLGELQARTAELAARNDAFAEQIDHQSATIDVLKEMSASQGDARPVLDLIIRRATELCGAYAGAVAEFDGERVHLTRAYGVEVAMKSGAIDAYAAQFPMVPSRGSVLCRAILDRELVHVRDLDADPDIFQTTRTIRHRSAVAVPLMRDGVVLGAMTIGIIEPGGLSDTQIELMKTFAEQAVIAIRSAETFRELEARTSDLAEALEQQTASAKVLEVISRSAFDLDTVFTTLVQSSRTLSDAAQCMLLLVEGDRVRCVKQQGWPKAFEDFASAGLPIDYYSGVGRAAMTGQVAHFPDVLADPDYRLTEGQRLAGYRALLSVPLLRDGRAVGVFSLGRPEPIPFTPRQIELVQMFADQAVIAIENVRLFDAVQERTAALARSVSELQALEETIRAVNSSLDLETVLATIVSRAVELGHADEGTIYEFDTTEEVFVPKSAFGMSEARVAQLRERRIRMGETHSAVAPNCARP